MIPRHREPTHPGVILLSEFLEPSGTTQVTAAGQMGIPLNRLNEIVNGRRGITADTAIRLSQLLGTSPEFWMNLQATWDIFQAAESLDFDFADERAEEPAPPAAELLRASVWQEPVGERRPLLGTERLNHPQTPVAAPYELAA